MHRARGDRGNRAGRRLCGVSSAALHESSGSLPELVDALLPSFGELSEAQIRGIQPSSAKPGRYTLGSKSPQSPSHFLVHRRAGLVWAFFFYLTKHIHRPRFPQICLWSHQYLRCAAKMA